MTRSFTFEDGDERVVNLSEDSEGHDHVRRPMMWTNIFKLHHILRSSWYFEQDFDVWWLSSSWGELCHDYLPNPEHTMLRAKLLSLEDKYGSLMSNRFPPQKDSLIDRQEKEEARAKVDLRNDFEA
ncbi:hypothetical protein SCHPADRAFT_906823 [Schizopora paradoxa]|uniref:Uncharacterized protein n=1 Tax=Schizopora paradoxa TaxID=27342 RepID=A0A0H2S0I0_9AGAM|nr:hypothetical protein SCHPADRAFT_906823 [Schizopora paradoxa]